jgi:hypothetical protein
VLQLHAAVHHHVQAGAHRALGGLFVHDAELHPHHLRPDLNGLLDDRRHLAGAAKDVYDLNRMFPRCLDQRRI